MTIGTPEELRRDFDRLFAAPPPIEAAGRECFIEVRAGRDRFALRLRELAGIEKRRKVVPLPCGDPALLGLAGIRGRLVPVYDLPAVLGYPASAKDEWRWVGLCLSGVHPVGLAFDMVGGFIRAASSDAHPMAAGSPAREHIHEVLTVAGEDGRVRGVLSVTSILAAIAQKARTAAVREETVKHET